MPSFTRIMRLGCVAALIAVGLLAVPAPVGAQFVQCTNQNFRAAIDKKAAANTKITGDKREGPFKIGGIEYKSPYGIEGKRTIPAGCFAVYQYALIYVSANTQAQLVYGSIFAKWAKLDAEKGPLGYPVSDEMSAGDAKGRVSYFQNGAVYWHPDVGAFGVWGQIFNLYNNKWGGPTNVGYPVSDERDWNVGAAKGAGGSSRLSQFQKADIFWTSANSTVGIWGYIRECYWKVYNAEAKNGRFLVPKSVSMTNSSGEAGTLYFVDTTKFINQRIEANKSVARCEWFTTNR